MMHEPSQTAGNYYATLPHNMAKSMHQGQQHTYATPFAAAALEPQIFPQTMHQTSEHSQLYPMQPVPVRTVVFF